jgi:hypothetical protein
MMHALAVDVIKSEARLQENKEDLVLFEEIAAMPRTNLSFQTAAVGELHDNQDVPVKMRRQHMFDDVGMIARRQTSNLIDDEAAAYGAHFFSVYQLCSERKPSGGLLDFPRGASAARTQNALLNKPANGGVTSKNLIHGYTRRCRKATAASSLFRNGNVRAARNKIERIHRPTVKKDGSASAVTRKPSDANKRRDGKKLSYGVAMMETSNRPALEVMMSACDTRQWCFSKRGQK